MINKLIIIITLFLILVFSFSCSEDVNINADYQDIPIIYCVLDPSSEYQYVKVNKSFLGEKPAHELAQNSSLLFYNNVHITLKNLKNNTVWTFNKVDIDKNEGTFANDQNIIYTSKIDFGNVDKDTEFELNVDIEGGKHIVTSRTKLISGGSFTQPSPMFDNVVSLTYYNGERSYKFYAGYLTNLYQTYLKFNYFEVKGNDTAYKSITIPLNKANLPVNYNNYEITQQFGIEYFYRNLKTYIPVVDGVTRYVQMPTSDKINSFEFQLFSVDENYNTYSQISAPSNGIVQHKPTFTNLNGAYGLFASRNVVTVLAKPNQETLDSIARGIYTKGLNFKGYEPRIDNYYYSYY